MIPIRANDRAAAIRWTSAVLLFFSFLEVVPLLAPCRASAQGMDAAGDEARTRIWGRVTTVTGEVHEGFLRWDRNEASWVDILNGTRSLAWEPTLDWIPEPGAGPARGDRVIEIGGYRITWDDGEAGFPSTAESGVRFGHLSRIRILEEDSVVVQLRSGGALGLSERRIELSPAPGVTVIMEGGSTDLGLDLRELLVEKPGGGVVSLEWEELAEVEFGPAPAGARPRSSRLHGTVEDRWGNRYTGYLAWDNDAALGSDTLVGSGNLGRRRQVRFEEIAALRPTVSGAEVALITGDTVRMVDAAGESFHHGSLQISDPGLGQVEIRWQDLEGVRFHHPDASPDEAAYDAFESQPLQGTVTTVTGAELTGLIRWDADEAFSWEILDGSWRDVTFDVELGQVASIERMDPERGSRRGARVTLRDGRVLELSGSNDLDEQNKGVLVRSAEEGVSGAEPPPWIRVRWPDFRSIRFHH